MDRRAARSSLRVYRCPVHGLVEQAYQATGIDPETGDPSGERLECPISVGYDDVCHAVLDGPVYVVELARDAADG